MGDVYPGLVGWETKNPFNIAKINQKRYQRDGKGI
jgi:hypothetical protein